MSSNLCLSSANKPNSIQVAPPPLKPMQLKQEKDQEEEEDEQEQSASSCSFNEDIVVVSSNIIRGEAEQAKEEEEEEGYHTPTSPRHRIPTAVECPPAPRKPSLRQRRQVKRKACCRIEITDVELMVFSAEMDEGRRRSKKAK